MQYQIQSGTSFCSGHRYVRLTCLYLEEIFFKNMKPGQLPGCNEHLMNSRLDTTRAWLALRLILRSLDPPSSLQRLANNLVSQVVKQRYYRCSWQADPRMFPKRSSEAASFFYGILSLTFDVDFLQLNLLLRPIQVPAANILDVDRSNPHGLMR